MARLNEMTADDAKNRFGQLLDAAQRAPVRVTKNGRPVTIVLSVQHISDYGWALLMLWPCNQYSNDTAPPFMSIYSITWLREFFAAREVEGPALRSPCDGAAAPIAGIYGWS